VIKPLKWLGYSLPPESKKIIGDLHWQEPGRMAQTMPVVSWLVRYETGANMKGLCRAAVLFGVISSSAYADQFEIVPLNCEDNPSIQTITAHYFNNQDATGAASAYFCEAFLTTTIPREVSGRCTRRPLGETSATPLNVGREIQTTTNYAPCPWKIGFWRLKRFKCVL
jgi:hypothetical protein